MDYFELLKAALDDPNVRCTPFACGRWFRLFLHCVSSYLWSQNEWEDKQEVEEIHHSIDELLRSSYFNV